MKSVDEMREMVDKIIEREPSERNSAQAMPAITIHGGGPVVVICGGSQSSLTIYRKECSSTPADLPPTIVDRK